VHNRKSASGKETDLRQSLLAARIIDTKSWAVSHFRTGRALEDGGDYEKNDSSVDSRHCRCRFSLIRVVAHFQAEFIFNLYRDFAVINIIR
jgi:hypothetical protein